MATISYGRIKLSIGTSHYSTMQPSEQLQDSAAVRKSCILMPTRSGIIRLTSIRARKLCGANYLLRRTKSRFRQKACFTILLYFSRSLQNWKYIVFTIWSSLCSSKPNYKYIGLFYFFIYHGMFIVRLFRAKSRPSMDKNLAIVIEGEQSYQCTIFLFYF